MSSRGALPPYLERFARSDPGGRRRGHCGIPPRAGAKLATIGSLASALGQTWLAPTRLPTHSASDRCKLSLRTGKLPDGPVARVALPTVDPDAVRRASQAAPEHC
jgi:hypothetical protein